MGYYTDYKLILKTSSNTDLDKYYYSYLKEQLIEEFDLDNNLELLSAKWYNYEEELKQFSTRYPDVLFILTGIGEEHYFESTELYADIWIQYFVNGKTYTDKLDYKFPAFDSNKLN